MPRHWQTTQSISSQSLHRKSNDS